MNTKTKVLILIKDRLDYDGNTIGLKNSAEFLGEVLVDMGYPTTVVKAVDGNSIDREVFRYKPQVVILEALWVTAAKLSELTLKYPKIGFIVRIHSNIPFLSMEGTAIKQIRELSNIDGVLLAVNNYKTANEMKSIFNLEVPYLPNLYTRPTYLVKRDRSPKDNDAIIDISCFGAIRPMKNQLIQALAAIHAANQLGKRLHFHINSTRVEQKADPILHNIEEAFVGGNHKLIEHKWENHPTFMQTVAQMDLGMQVSFSESYNIVTADHVHAEVPVLVSNEISWLGDEVKVPTTNLLAISRGIIDGLANRDRDIAANKFNLDLFNNTGKEVWSEFLDKYSE